MVILVRNKRSASTSVLIMAVLSATPILASEFDAELIAGATHTDNVTLAPENEQDELVYRLEPSFRLLHETTRITTNADYRLQAFRYRDFEETEVFHAYDLSIRADLVPEHLFFEVGGNRSQSIRDPALPIPQSNLPISGNRQDRDEYYASPSFQVPLGRTIAVQGAYRHSWMGYSDDGQLLSPSDQQKDGNFSIDNYRQGRGLTWALRYNWQQVEYEDDSFFPWEYQAAVAELGFWVSGNTRLFAAGGFESAWDAPLDPALEDELWEVGFARRVGESLSAEFALGERSFGKSWRGKLDFEFRRGSTSFSYAETPTTQDNSRLRRSSLGGSEVPDDFLDRPGSGERYLSSRLEWLLNLAFRRTEVSLTLFDDERTDRVLPDGTRLADERQQGLSVSAAYRIGARTHANLSGSWVERELSDSDTSDLFLGSVAVKYQFGARTSLTLEYQYTEEEGENPLSIRDYAANSVSLFITRSLF